MNESGGIDMKSAQMKKKIAGVLLGLGLLMGIGFALSTAVIAQDRDGYDSRRGRNWDGYPNWGGSFELRQTALNAGYNEGMKEGGKDRARGTQSSLQQFSAYQKATKDYNSRYGDRDLYSRYFREAFRTGYYDGLGIQGNYDTPGRNNDNRRRDRRGRNWDQYGAYGGSFALRQTALNAGYNEGIKKGRDDGRRNRGYDYRRFNEYDKADKDYSSRLGDKELYRRYYREGFENGYSDGYNGY